MIDLNALTAAFASVYGSAEGNRVCMTVLPGVLKDFQHLLTAAAPGAPVREEYRLEDKRATLVLEGRGGEKDVSAQLLPFTQ